jgi:predicted Zn-dependent peptidase
MKMNSLKKVFLGAAMAAVGQLLAAAPSVKLPPYKTVTLKNGMTVVLMEQHKVPLVSLQLSFRQAGSTSDPAGKEGLASVTGDLLRRGTKKYSSLQISEALDSVGATFGTYTGLDFTYCAAEFMAKDSPKCLDLVAEMLTQPTFPEDEFEKLRAQSIDAVLSAKDSARGVLGRYYSSFLYGGHPYARPTGGDERSLASITRGDVAGHYASTYTPDGAVLVVAGAFKAGDMEKMVSQRFGGWKTAAKAKPIELPKPAKAEGRKLLLVDKPDATQTYFMVGGMGVARANPDRVAIEVVNTLFGGRFTSMVNTALRIKTGLTYGANSGFSMQKAAGSFMIVSFTQNSTTEKALDLTLETLRELHQNGFTEEDLLSAKAYIKGTYPTSTLETTAQLAARLSLMQLYGLPDSDVNDYYAKVDAVTADDARRIIREYFPLDDLRFALIGKADEIRPGLEKYAADIKAKSISEPGF